MPCFSASQSREPNPHCQLGNPGGSGVNASGAGRRGVLTGPGLPGSASLCGPCVARRRNFRVRTGCAQPSSGRWRADRGVETLNSEPKPGVLPLDQSAHHRPPIVPGHPFHCTGFSKQDLCVPKSAQVNAGGARTRLQVTCTRRPQATCDGRDSTQGRRGMPPSDASKRQSEPCLCQWPGCGRVEARPWAVVVGSWWVRE